MTFSRDSLLAHFPIRRSVGALLIAALIPLAACSGGSTTTSSDKVKDGGDLKIAAIQDAPTLDPDQVITSVTGLRVAEAVYGRLYETDSRGEAEPALATGYTLSADKLTWTFTLRDDAKFSDGKPITAADVVFSLDEARKGDYVGSFFASIDRISSPSARTVTIHTSKPFAGMVQVLTVAAAGIVPKNYEGTTRDKFFAKPVSSGPWVVTSNQPGVGITLKPNTFYYGAKPHLDSVTYSYTPSADTRVLQLRSNQVQMIESPSYSQMDSLSKGNTRVLTFPSTESNFLTLNSTKSPTDDIHFRRALSLAIDREAIVKTAVGGIGVPISTWIPAVFTKGADEDATPTYDVEAARRELAKSKTPNGATITLLYDPSLVPSWSLAAQLIQSDLKAIGVDLKLKSASGDVISAAKEDKTYDVGITNQSYDYMDASENIDYAIGTDNNRTYADVTELSKLADALRMEFDASARARTTGKIVDLLQQQSSTIGLWSSPFVYATSAKVHGLKVAPTGNYDLSALWMN